MNDNLCLGSDLDNCINIQVCILYLYKKKEIAGQIFILKLHKFIIKLF